jgi:ADP-ribose pyrophosphatase
MNRHPRVELLSSKCLVSGRVFDVLEESVRLPSGLDQRLIVLAHPGAVAIAARFPDGEILLVRQYRHAVGDWLVEVPAGRLDPGEAPLAAAQRELEEETGYRAGTLEPLGWVWTTPGFTNEKIWLFLARDLEATEQSLQADEVLSVEALPAGEALERALDGAIQDAKSVCCLVRAARRWKNTSR